MNKQIKAIFIALGVLSLGVSCEKDNSTLDTNVTTITAGIEHSADTKTSLDSDLKVLWSANDMIKVFNTSTLNGSVFTLTGDAGETTGTFAGASITGTEPNYAIYPSSISTGTLATSTLSFTLPATQIYTENGFAIGANPMVAKETEEVLEFKNICGILKLSLTGGTQKVSSIVVTSASDNLAGEGTVDASSATLELSVTNGAKSVTLNCSNTELSATATDFYIVLPPTKAALTVDIITESSGTMTKVIPVNDNNEIKRARITKMESLAYVADDAPTYTDGSYSGDGIQLNIPGIKTLWWAPVNLGYKATGEIEGRDARNGEFYKWGAKTPGDAHNTTASTWPAEDNPCPTGWRVPTKTELENLSKTSNGKYNTNGPYGNGSGKGYWFGTNASTASTADPKGCLWFPLSGFSDDPSNETGFYWSSTEYDSSDAWHLFLHSSSCYVSNYDKSTGGLSVRCVQ